MLWRIPQVWEQRVVWVLLLSAPYVATFGEEPRAWSANCLYQLTHLPGDRFGYRVKSLKDTGGDGHAEVLVATQASSGNLSEIHVYSGASGTWLYSLTEVAPSWHAPEYNEFLGVCGDVNGDGVGDFIVAHSRYLIEGDGTHMASVFSGSDGALLRQLQGPHDVARADSALTTLDGLGDLDSDGVPDYGIVGTQSGKIWLFSGTDGATISEILVDFETNPGEPVVPLATALEIPSEESEGLILRLTE